MGTGKSRLDGVQGAVTSTLIPSLTPSTLGDVDKLSLLVEITLPDGANMHGGGCNGQVNTGGAGEVRVYMGGGNAGKQMRVWAAWQKG